MTFEIPLLNPFRFVNLNPAIDPRYNTLPFDLQNDIKNPNGPYVQKWQINDTAKVQVLSDYAPGDGEGQSLLSFDIYDVNFPTTVYKNIPLNAADLAIVGQTFLIYEGEIDFAEFAAGNYVGEISYTDENEDVQIWQTSRFNVAEIQYKTQLVEYKNTFNDKGVIFDTDILFNIRIESTIREYTPKSAAEDYIDQEYNNYSLNDIPYRTFKYYIGKASGLPNWIIDKMNLIFTLNSIQIDGVYYNKVSGQEFELTRPTGGINEDGFMSIQIMPSDNFNLTKFDTTGLANPDELKVIRKDIHYPANSADIVINGIFKTYTNLVGLYIINTGLDAFEIKIGTSAPVEGVPSDDIKTLEIPADETSVHFINSYFKVAKTLYLSGFEGTNCDIYVIYDQLDAPVLDISAPTQSPFPKGYFGYYFEVDDGDFELDWNVGTGQGLRKYIGCSLVNKNGLFDIDGNNISGCLPQIWDQTQPDTRQTSVGDNEITLELDNIPPITPRLRGQAGNKPAFGSGNVGIWVTFDPDTSKNVGDAISLDPVPANDPVIPIENQPKAIILAAFVKITDD